MEEGARAWGGGGGVLVKEEEFLGEWNRREMEAENWGVGRVKLCEIASSSDWQATYKCLV